MRRKVQDSIIILGCNNILKEQFSLIRQQNLVWILGGSMTGQAWHLSYWGDSSLKAYRSLRLWSLLFHTLVCCIPQI